MRAVARLKLSNPKEDRSYEVVRLVPTSGPRPWIRSALERIDVGQLVRLHSCLSYLSLRRGLTIHIPLVTVNRATTLHLRLKGLGFLQFRSTGQNTLFLLLYLGATRERFRVTELLPLSALTVTDALSFANNPAVEHSRLKLSRSGLKERSPGCLDGRDL